MFTCFIHSFLWDLTATAANLGYRYDSTVQQLQMFSLDALIYEG